jgi:hypothetical protein
MAGKFLKYEKIGETKIKKKKLHHEEIKGT